MILEEIISQFIKRFQHEKRAQVCLWFDERCEFMRLLFPLEEYLAAMDEPPFQLFAYNAESFHGQIWIKHQIYKSISSLPPKEGNKRRFVVYLPLSEDRLEGPDDEGNHHLEFLLEYKVTDLIWRIGGKRPTLFSFLRQAGVSLPHNPADQRRLWDGGQDSLLSKYVAKFCDRPMEFWQAQLTPEVAQSRLIEDVVQTILDLALAPDAIWEELQDKVLHKEFQQAVKERYGFEFPGKDPAEWVEEFVTIVALTEAFIGYNGPQGFPFSNKLPPIPVREAHIHLLHRWLRDAESRPAWDRWILKVEENIDLSKWAEGRKGHSFGFPHLVKQRWIRTLEAFEQVADKSSEVHSFLKKHGTMFKREAEYARTSHNQIGSWDLLLQLRDFLSTVHSTQKRLEKEQTIEEIAGLYVDTACEIDRQHLKIRHQAIEKELPFIGKVADRVYAEYIKALNQEFYDHYPVDETANIPGIPAVTKQLEKVIWNTKGKRAVIIVDGLRYDCAMEIKSALPGREVHIEPVSADLPAVTPIGMTAILPISNAQLAFEHHGNNMRPKVNGKDMGQRENRIAYLREFGADCRDINDIEQMMDAPEDLGDLLVIFGHEDFDHIGHGHAETLIRHLYVEIERLVRLTRKLHGWGYPSVHIVTDHGFILLGEEWLPPEVPCDKKWCHVLKERFAIVPSNADLSLKTFPFDWDETMRVALPPGMAFFKREKSFSHGGGTLQELIVPHLISRIPESKVKRIDVEVILPTFKLIQSAVKIELRAKVKGGRDAHQMHLFVDAGRTLALDVLRTEESGKRRSVLATARPKEVRLDGVKNKEVSVRLFFNSSLSFQEGELLDLEIQDTETGEQFPPGGIKLTVGRNM
jgi:hypothetical protein